MNRAAGCTFRALLVNFEPQFSAPSFANFVVLAIGWALCVGRHSLSRILQFGCLDGWGKHHSALYRFLGRARWSVDALGRVLVTLALRWLPSGPIHILVDDTLSQRSGPRLWGGGMHFDALQSTYGRGADKHTAIVYGHNWVIVSLWIPLPWNPGRGMALPVASRLYRQRKYCTGDEYLKRTELAVALLQLLTTWLPAHRQLIVLGDAEYTCRIVLRNAPSRMHFIGPMSMKAAFYDLPRPKPGRGRPAKKGQRLPSPRELAANDAIAWQRHTLALYGHSHVDVLFKTQVGLWYQVTGTRRVRMVVTRDPTGRIDDRAYLVTDPDMTACETATTYAKRWPAEHMHANLKQCLGAEQPQNGWWRRRRGEPRPTRKIAGPQPHRQRGRTAVERTFPFALVVYSLVVLWYYDNGRPAEDVERVRARAPWYRHKTEPSFADMLTALRRYLARGFLAKHAAGAFGEKRSSGPEVPAANLLELLLTG